MTKQTAPKWRKASVWILRILTGCTFILSGWAKAVDPYGFYYKIGEYLSVWGIDGIIPSEVTMLGAVLLAVFEMVTGVLLAAGCLRRSTPICALALMAFMLPLTAYIAIAEPVADCGCFGDMLVISNPATFVKNVVLTAMLVLLLLWHSSARPLFRPGLQWVVIAISTIYGITLAFIGWNFQPVVDFRAYPVGSEILASEDENAETPIYIYVKDGKEREFSLDELPDSTWTFVRSSESVKASDELALFDGEEEVTAEVLDYPEGDMLIMVVSQPDIAYVTRARFANELYDYAEANDINMVAFVAASGESLALWKDLARPRFPVYSATDTSLKQLARGATALVMVHDGRIAWKRNFANVNPDLLDNPDPLDSVRIFDDGRVALWLTSAFVAALLLLILMQLSFTRPKTKNDSKQQYTNETTDSRN